MPLTTIGIRLVIAAVCIMATNAIVWRIDTDTRLSAAHAGRFDLNAVPRTCGQWTAVVSELDPRLFAKLGAVSSLDLRWQNDRGYRAASHMAVYSTADVVLPHPPDLCYRLNGWSLVNDERHTVDSAHPYRLLCVEQSGLRRVVVYWYQLGSDVVLERDELRALLQKRRLTNTNSPPLIKVMLEMPVGYSEKESLTALTTLGQYLYGWISRQTSKEVATFNASDAFAHTHAREHCAE